MEEAIFLKSINDIDEVCDNYNRIYYGEEFCQNRLQNPKDFKKIYEFTADNNKKLTIVFPYLTDDFLSKVDFILDNIDISAFGFEVVANDWGTIHYIMKKYPEINITVGRLLNKIKRDPRIKSAETILNKEIYDSYKKSNLLTENSMRFLKELGVKNIEFDCPMQGIELKKSDFNYFVHYPFGYITTTRLCIKNLSTYGNGGSYSCKNKLCEFTTLEYKNHRFPCRVFQKGNTVFYYNKISKECLGGMGFKRIIEHKEL